ncbi:MAG: serine/threonine-protein kinase [Waterburya sp.]
MINLVGQNLQNGKYHLEGELGRGSFGITYQATNLALEREVAIKMLAPFWGQDSNLTDWVERFQNEAKKLAKCSHPNIVRVLDFFCENGYPYIVMDYIRGLTLDQIVSEGNPLSEITALEYIKQTGEALRVVHEKALLLHQDVKPKNLILCQDNQQVILIDFGIARKFSGEQLQNPQNLLSEGYAPIEQYLVDSPRTMATDIYGLAATLYTLLTGKIPTSAISRAHGCILESPRQIRPELSKTLSETVMWGMELESDRRPSCVSEWLARLTTDSNKTITCVKSASIKFVNPILGAKMWGKLVTSPRKIPLFTGVAAFGLVTLLTVALSNGRFQTGRTIDNNSSNIRESPQVSAEPSQSPAILGKESVSNQKLPVNPVSSSEESSVRSEPQTNFDLLDSEPKTDQKLDVQRQAASVSLKQTTRTRSPISASTTPQLFITTKTPIKSKPAIFSSGKTKPSIPAKDRSKLKPQIFSNSASVPATKRQPEILKNRKDLKKIKKVKPTKKHKRKR